MITLEQRLQELEPTIKKIAKYNPVYNYDAEDVEQDLRMLLIKCYNNFDESKKVKFSTYFISSAINYIKRLQVRVGAKNKMFVNTLNDTINIDGFSSEVVDLIPQELEEESPYIELLPSVLKLLDTMPFGDWVKEYFFEGLLQTEIAQKYNTSQQIVARNIRHTLEIIRNKLQDKVVNL